MANSQFRMFSSGDVGAPILSGSTTGSLLNLLNYCLVDPGVGWTKPLADSGSCGVFRQGTGSLMTLYVRNNGGGTAGNKEARITGFESVSNISLTFPTGSNSFPSASQQAGLGQPPGGVLNINQSGYLIARVSNTVDATIRPWLVFADSSSMYCFIYTGDNAANQLAFSFGDFYALKSGSNDDYRCLITGRITENSATVTVDKTDVLSTISAVAAGHYSPRSYTGAAGTSIAMGKHGDVSKGSATALLGTVTWPNPVDTAVYISPVWVTESTTSTIRGRMRGFYQFLHAITGVTDGQTFVGSGDFAGKTFRIIKTSGNGGVYLIETSNTVETND